MELISITRALYIDNINKADLQGEGGTCIGAQRLKACVVNDRRQGQCGGIVGARSRCVAGDPSLPLPNDVPCWASTLPTAADSQARSRCGAARRATNRLPPGPPHLAFSRHITNSFAWSSCSLVSSYKAAASLLLACALAISTRPHSSGSVAQPKRACPAPGTSCSIVVKTKRIRLSSQAAKSWLRTPSAVVALPLRTKAARRVPSALSRLAPACMALQGHVAVCLCFQCQRPS